MKKQRSTDKNQVLQLPKVMSSRSLRMSRTRGSSALPEPPTEPTTEECSDATESGLSEEGQGSDPPTIEEVPQPEVQAPLTSESVRAAVLEVLRRFAAAASASNAGASIPPVTNSGSIVSFGECPSLY